MNLFVILSIGILLPAFAKGTIIRPNYGIMFKPVFQLTNDVCSWKHTFVIPIRDLYQGIPEEQSFCEELVNGRPEIKTIRHYMCSKFENSMTAMKDDRSALVDNIKTLQNQLRDLLQINPSSRHKRGLSDWISNLVSQAFGLVSEKDFRNLQKNLNLIKDNINNMSQGYTDISSDMHSFELQLDERINNFEQGRIYNSKMINYTIDSLIEWRDEISGLADAIQQQKYEINSMVKAIGIIHSHYSYDISNLNFLKVRLTESFSGIIDLFSHKLNVNMVNPVILNNTLYTLANQLKSKFNKIQVQHFDLAYYYSTHDVIFNHDAKHLYITVNIPLKNINDNIFDVYQIISVYIPINSTSNLTTKIKGLPRYFGVSASTHYIEMSDFDLTSCSGDKMKRCQDVMPIKQNTMESCSLSLYLDETNNIERLCNIIMTNRQDSKAIPLGNGEYFITVNNDTYFTESCYGINDINSQTSKIKGCSFCIISPKCNCIIISSRFILEPDYSGCENMNSSAVITHPINLAVARYFYNDTKLDKIKGNDTFRSNTFLPLPSMSLYLENLDNVISTDQKLSVDMSKTAKLIKRKQDLFQSATSKLRNDLKWSLRPGVKETTIGLPAISIIISIVSCLLCGYTLYKLNIIMLLLMTMGNQPLLVASKPNVIGNPPIIVFLTSTTSPPSTDASDYKNNDLMNLVLILAYCLVGIICLNCCGRVLKMILKLHKKRNESVIVDEFELIETNDPLCPGNMSKDVAIKDIHQDKAETKEKNIRTSIVSCSSSEI